VSGTQGYPGIDGTVELFAELDRLSEGSRVARLAPRGTGVAGYLARGIDQEAAAGILDGQFWRLTTHLIQQLGIWWSPSGFAAIPVMTPWCIRDRSARYDQGPESWGAPRADGYLRDDNSIIKKLPLPLTVVAGANSPYAGRRPWRGFTACHIWRELEDGGIGGVDQWIYSNMVNLIWLPSPIMSLTDHNPRVKSLLRRTSRRIFEGKEGATTKRYVDHAWARLTAPVADEADELDLGALAMFDVSPAFVSRRLAYLDRFVNGADEVLGGKPLSKKIICTRYSVGMPLLDRDALELFRADLADYASAVRAGL
jgi:hypothetical protein